MKTFAVVLILAYNLIPGPLRWEENNPVTPNTSTTYWYIDTTLPPGMPAIDVQPAMDRSWKNWENLSCSTWTAEFQGDGNAGDRGFTNNARSMVTFEDPFGQLGPGVYAANVRWDDNTQHSYNGRTWFNIYETDTVFNTGWNFQTDALVEGNCSNYINIEGVATHEFGHGLGYAHSCESGEGCVDPDEADAIMYWSVDACDPKDKPQVDDQRMHALVYGAEVMSEFTTVNEAGSLPLAVDFIISTFADAVNLSAVWDYGDGNNETAVDPTHTYTEEGRYTVTATISGESASCRGTNFEHTYSVTDAVLACPDPAPDFTFSVDDLTVNFNGLVEGGGLGCIDTLVWDFGDGGSAGTRTPTHIYEDYGTYEVSFAADGAGGAAGPVSHSITLEAKGCKCAVSAPSSRSMSWAVTGFALLAGLLVWRRRREVRG